MPHAARPPLTPHADLRDVISLEKDVEGLNHRYRYALYHNIRTLAEHNGKKCVLPCTPLAVAKILSALGMFEENAPVGRQLQGRTVVVVNRSEVVGRPLAAMCAAPAATPTAAPGRTRLARSVEGSRRGPPTPAPAPAPAPPVARARAPSCPLPAPGVPPQVSRPCPTLPARRRSPPA